MASLTSISRGCRVVSHTQRSAPSVHTPKLVPKPSRVGATVIVRGIPVSGPGQASHVESSGVPAGQITIELVDSMRAKIAEALESDNVYVTDVNGDGRHVVISVVSKLFEGKSQVQRQRMVYKVWHHCCIQFTVYR